MRAVVLLSGGIDSAVALAMAKSEGFACHTLAFRYGQRHAVELVAARRISAALGAVEHRECELDLGWVQSALVGGSGGERSNLPATYVPGRNLIFLSMGLALAETVGAAAIFIGANADDRAGYPDCREEFLAAWEVAAQLGTESDIKLRAPLLSWHKARIVREGAALGVDFALTHSCYFPTGEVACGACDACGYRRRGFDDAGIPDPARYR